MTLAETTVLKPSAPEGLDIAVVWIIGENQVPSDYVEVAEAFQVHAAQAGLRPWVGIPDFAYGKEKKAKVDEPIEEAMTALTGAGFDSDNWFLAGHSLGGALT